MSIEAPKQLQTTYSDNSIDCHVCQRVCHIGSGKRGVCGGYFNDGGELIDLTYGRITTAQITKLGWAPVSRYQDPEMDMLSVGSRGCNFNCVHCANGDHAWAKHEQDGSTSVTAKDLVDYAQFLGAKAIAANFNEGLLAIAFWRDIFMQAKKAGLHTVAVTNGYSTEEALNFVLPYLDVYRCDIKAISREAMQKQVRGIEPIGVLNGLLHVKRAAPRTHIETVTMLFPGANDSDQEITAIARWIKKNLGEETPWNISPFFAPDFSSQRSVPSYISSQQLSGSQDGRTAFSISFSQNGSRTNASLILGKWGFSDQDQTLDIAKHPELKRAVAIGKSVGLHNVIPKLDGH